MAAANQTDATQAGSIPSENASAVPSSSSSLQRAGGTSENITPIDSKLYEAAVKGNFSELADKDIANLRTPMKNTVLHIHLTSPEKGSKYDCNPFLLIFGQVNDQTFQANASEEFVEQILDKCGDPVQLRNAKEETPLHVAARYGHSSIVKLLIERAKAFPEDIESGIGAEKKLIRATNREKDTALHEAVRYNHTEVVEILLEMDKDHSYSANSAHETPLYLASERQYKQTVRKILEVLKSPAYDGPNCRTALHAAVINRDKEMAQDLLKNEHLRDSIRHADEEGWIPLHHAAKIGDKDLAYLLLEQDKNTAYMQDNKGRTALHIAVQFDRDYIMKMILLYCPACSELVDNEGCNALHYATKGKGLTVWTIVSNLWLSNLYNEKDVKGNTPLHHVVTSNFYSEDLMRHQRVDKEAMNSENQTALDVAYANSNRSDTSRILINELFIALLESVRARRSRRRHLYLVDEEEQRPEKSPKFSKEARESHLLMATLIATVSFAAGFTLPGGTIQDGEQQGKPILGQNASFKAFIVSDTIALVLSASAAFIHLFSPLSKAKWEEHLLSQAAFSFTLVAVASMIIAFTTGTYAVLGSSSLGIAVLITALSFLVIFRHVLRLTYGGGLHTTFIKIVVDVILFPFVNLPSISSAGLCSQFKRGWKDYSKDDFHKVRKNIDRA